MPDRRDRGQQADLRPDSAVRPTQSAPDRGATDASRTRRAHPPPAAPSPHTLIGSGRNGSIARTRARLHRLAGHPVPDDRRQPPSQRAGVAAVPDPAVDIPQRRLRGGWRSGAAPGSRPGRPHRRAPGRRVPAASRLHRRAQHAVVSAVTASASARAPASTRRRPSTNGSAPNWMARATRIATPASGRAQAQNVVLVMVAPYLPARWLLAWETVPGVVRFTPAHLHQDLPDGARDVGPRREAPTAVRRRAAPLVPQLRLGQPLAQRLRQRPRVTGRDQAPRDRPVVGRAHRLGMAADVGRDHRDPAGQALGRRHAEGLPPRRRHDEVGLRAEQVEPLERHRAGRTSRGRRCHVARRAR